MMDLVFTNNPSVVKSSYSVLGISDHAMVVTDLDMHPKCVTQKPQKSTNTPRQTGIQYILKLKNFPKILSQIMNLVKKS